MMAKVYSCVRGVGLLLVSAQLASCALQSAPLSLANDQFKQGQPVLALETLDDPEGEISEKDKLLKLMNKGLVLQNLKRYEESLEPLLQAADLIKEQERISVSEFASTLALNEWAAAYKGEYSERLWVHSYLMMSFLMLNQTDNAAVEARRALKVFDKYPKPLQDAWFSRALIALSFDSAGQSNDAYIEYKKLYETLPDNSEISDLLYSLATRLGFEEEAKAYSKNGAGKNKTDSGELILFVSQGFIPKKIPGNIVLPPATRISWPQYSYFNRAGPVSYSIKDNLSSTRSHTVTTNIGTLAGSSLADRGLRIAAKQVARVGVKNSIVDEVKDSDALAGSILEILFFVLEEADTRGWETLPGYLSVIRIPLSPGLHDINISALNGSRAGQSLGTFTNLRINAGQRVFRKVRF